jgi:hypothetical protein
METTQAQLALNVCLYRSVDQHKSWQMDPRTVKQVGEAYNEVMNASNELLQSILEDGREHITYAFAVAALAEDWEAEPAEAALNDMVADRISEISWVHPDLRSLAAGLIITSAVLG